MVADLYCTLFALVFFWVIGSTILTKLHATDAPAGEVLLLRVAAALAITLDLGVVSLWVQGYSFAECHPCAQPDDLAREKLEVVLVAVATVVSTALTVWAGTQSIRRLSQDSSPTPKGWRFTIGRLAGALWVLLCTTPGWLTLLVLGHP